MYQTLTANYSALFRPSSPLYLDWSISTNFDLIGKSRVLQEAFNDLRLEVFQFCTFAFCHIRNSYITKYSRRIQRPAGHRGRSFEEHGHCSGEEINAERTFSTFCSIAMGACIVSFFVLCFPSPEGHKFVLEISTALNFVSVYLLELSNLSLHFVYFTLARLHV
jgi:hypothetical protein